MISLRKFLEWVDPEAEESGGTVPPELSAALRQALRMLLEGIPLRSTDKRTGIGARAELALLLGRLEKPIEPFDALEIASAALNVYQQDATADANSRQRDEVEVQISEKQAELTQVLRQAFKTLLEGYPAGGNAAQAMKALVRRVEGPLEPFDALEIAGEALHVWERDAREARERRHVSEARQAELATASLRALQMVLAAKPLDGEADGDREAAVQRAVTELCRRCEGPLAPGDVIGIAKEAVAVLEKSAAESQRARQERQQRIDRDGELSKALLRGLERVLSALPPAGLEGEGGEGSEPAASELLRRVKGPLRASDIAAIVDRAVAGLKSGYGSGTGAETRPDPLAQALIQAFQMLLGGLPLRANERGEVDAANRRAIGELLERLERPVDPFDVVEIASDALAVLERDAEEAASAARVEKDVAQTDNLSGALLEALRMLIGGLPMLKDGAGQAEGSGENVIADLLQRLAQPLAPFDVLEIANETLTALEQEHKAELERHRLHNEELQAMIAMLTDTVSSLSVQKSGSIARLQQIERRIEQTSMLEDLRSLKASLADCLGAVREAAAHQQKQAAETIQLVERQISRAKSRLPAERSPETDEIHHLSETSGVKPAEYMVVFLLDRENSIASRFGDEVRQSILRFVNQRLKEALLPSDRIVRWKGAAFLASVRRAGTLPDIRAEMSSVATIHVPPFVEVGNRSIRLPVSLSWAVFPQSRFPSLERLFEKVDEFILRTQRGLAG